MAKCDAKDCDRAIRFYCGCRRCDSEPHATEAFFSCDLPEHQYAGSVKHERIRGREAEWFGGNEDDRAAFLRP